MAWDDPLTHFQKINTHRAEEAEAALSKTLSDIKVLNINNRKRFHLKMNAVNFGDTSLVFNRFGTETKLKSTLHDDPVFFLFGRSAPSQFSLGNESIVVSPEKAVLISPKNSLEIKRAEDSEIIVLRTPLKSLLHHFVHLTGQHHRGSLIFDYDVDLKNGPGAMLKRMINYIVYEFNHNDQIIKNHSLMNSYDEMLMTALLSLPHKHREKLYVDHCKNIVPGVVRCAEEYMAANLKEVISISDLMRICGCSQSALFSAFRSARGYTPMEFLVEQRLQNVRKKLLYNNQEASVFDIAMDSGFRHLGRFSSSYKKRFGEHPSDTLRNRH